MITLVCSDRGRHPARRVAIAGRDIGPIPWVGRVEKDASLVRQSVPNGGDPRAVVERARRELADQDRYELRCTTCRRHLQLRKQTWLQLIDGLTARGVSRADISDLPF